MAKMRPIVSWPGMKKVRPIDEDRRIESMGEIPGIESINPRPDLSWGSTPQNHSFVTHCLFPTAALMANGHPAVVFRGVDGTGSGKVVVTRHTDLAYVTVPLVLFPYDQFNYNVINWNNNLLAICVAANFAFNAPLHYRVSSDLGATWSVEADLNTGLNQTFCDGPIANQWPALWITTNKAQDTIYLFYYKAPLRQIWYKTCTVDPPTTWSAEAYTGITTGTPGFNFGNDTGEGAQYRSFVLTESDVTGTWLAHFQDGTGTEGDTKALYWGTMGGAWAKLLDQNETGTLIGYAGATGGVFIGSNGTTWITYDMDDQVNHVNFWTYRTISGLWNGPVNEVPGTPPLSFGAGQGLYVPKYDKNVVWGHARVDGTLRLLVVDAIVQVTILF